MKATLEPVAWTLRIHSNPDAVHGEPYFASATVTADDLKCATLRGFVPGKVSKAVMRAAFRVLREASMTHCMWTRAEEDGFRTVKMDLATQKMTVLR